MWYSFNVYQLQSNGKTKKVATHKYPNKKQAEAAQFAIRNFRKGRYVYQPRENAPYRVAILGGYTCSEITVEQQS